ncbi:MAG: hypothetical protein O3A00_05695 [Planctomycetota bacterium]|nr:hypothetical protein [Planctomycetota bacterium]
MIRSLLLFSVAASLTIGQSAIADGLAYQLPADGAWLKYEIKMKIPRAPEEFRDARGTLKMSSVGKETVDGKACRWIEFAMNMKVGEREQEIVAKVLVPEADMKTGGKPFENKVRGWIRKRANQDAEALGDRDPGPLPAFLAGPLQGEKKLDATEITNAKLGKLQAEGVQGLIEYKERDRKYRVTFDSRKHKKSPFGVVSSKMKVERESDGEFQIEVEIEFELIDLGTGAKSQLQEPTP